MFTGIIESAGKVKAFEKRPKSALIAVDTGLTDADLNIGDSIAVNGVCLTITKRDNCIIWADIGAETLKVTTLGNLKAGDHVNIERPLKLGARLSGHLVQGHVDAIGKIVNINKLSEGDEVTLQIGSTHLQYIVKKGSIAVNGISLTIAECADGIIKIFLIPHTMEVTTFKYAKAGDAVNLEVDIIGKYVEKLLNPKDSAASAVTEDFLREHGFL